MHAVLCSMWHGVVVISYLSMNGEVASKHLEDLTFTCLIVSIGMHQINRHLQNQSVS